MNRYLTLVLLTTFVLGCNSRLPDEVAKATHDLPEVIDFNFHVRPILSDRCFHCHGFDENARRANLRLDTEEAAKALISESGSTPIVPGDPDKSAVVERILSQDPELLMPPKESKLELSAVEKAILVKWIEQGASWKKHWVYIPPEKAELPKLKDESWPKNEIDYFVLRKLESLGLNPSEEAARETLVRRLSFDLTGLPPTPEEVAQFKEDKSANAYENLVDKLLASPHFGERWAWEWLDVARYADTNGYQADPTRTMWPWRDWVVKAFNDNMPFDDFTIKQIAGDLLPDAGKMEILATAFNRNHPYNGEGGKIAEEVRVQNVFDRVETVGTAWMGLTLNCSRCHDHKFDAISQKEYYQLFDYFNQTSESGKGSSGTILPVVDVSPEEDLQKVAELRGYLEEIAGKVDEMEIKKFPREEGLPTSKSKEIQKATVSFYGVFDKQSVERRGFLISRIYEYFIDKDPSYANLVYELWKARDSYDKQLGENLRVMVMDQIPERRSTHILSKGIYSATQEEVFAGVPAVLPELPEDMDNNRLALARWLVSEEHPLTARVTVNRYWQAFFGSGIVKTIEDFGVQGALPSHPEVLDWLAVDFRENGWDIKALFKKIVMSATYRQSSKVTEQLLEADPENEFLARATRIRLPSWMLRDQALFISGLLVDSIGGVPVKPYQPEGIWEEATFGKIKYQQGHGDELYRRTLYTFWRRIVGPTMLFDNSTRQVCEVKALRTNTPLHALTTLNDITYVEAAKVLAERALKAKTEDTDRLEYMFELATSRKPKEKEIRILKNRLDQLKQQYGDAKEEARKITSIGEYVPAKNLGVSEHAAFTVLGSLVLNLDETITRQ